MEKALYPHFAAAFLLSYFHPSVAPKFLASGDALNGGTISMKGTMPGRPSSESSELEPGLRDHSTKALITSYRL